MVQHLAHLAARLVGIDLYAVADRVGRKQTYDAGAAHALVLLQLVQHGVGIGKQLGRLLTYDLVFENARILARQLPAEEKRRPVYVGAQHRDVHVLKRLHAQLTGGRRLIVHPVQLLPVGSGMGQTDRLGSRLLAGMLIPGNLVLLVNAGDKGRLEFRVQQALGHPDGARRVRHIDHGFAVVLLYLDRCVGLGGGGTADQQRQLEALTLHLFGHVHHLVERRCDQARQPYDIGSHFTGSLENGLAGDHNPQVDDLVVVALQHNADDVLADVVHVPLHRSEHYLAVAVAALFLGFDVGLQIGHRPLHHPGGFDHLRQKHLARAKQIADHVHAVHQGPFDHV
ncbi:hypothetical protein LMCDFJHI_02901 [Aeromonas salmonicida]